MERHHDDTTTNSWIDRLRDEAGIGTPNSLIGLLIVIILIIVIIQLL
jgi:hypothetical protein